MSRRRWLASALNGAAGLAAASALAGCHDDAARRPATATTTASVTSWAAERRPPYLVAHRGAGAVIPEHTLPSYQAALDWGAQCMEISVGMSSDGVLYCHHDATLDRTTTLTGRLAERPSSYIDAGRVRIPRLGPRWLGNGMPTIPRLHEALDLVAHRAVLCVEAKDDVAFEPILNVLHTRDLMSTVIIKVHSGSPRLATAREEGLPVFAYLGTAGEASLDNISRLADQLDPATDYLVLPVRDGDDFLAEDRYERAVGSGVPVWSFPVQRRSEAAWLADHGVVGMITPNLGYLSERLERLTGDDWESGALTAGEMTKEPYSESYAMSWKGNGEVGLSVPKAPSFVTMGQMCPLDDATGSYELAFEARFDPTPSIADVMIMVVFGHADDSYFSDTNPGADGYHAVVRADGGIAIYAHSGDGSEPQLLAGITPMSRPQRSEWMPLRLRVTPHEISWSRGDTMVQVADRRYRGGYFHIGRSMGDGEAHFRTLTVS